MMGMRRLTAPAGLPVSVEEAKAHLRIDGDHDDTVLARMIAAAVDHLDGAKGILGRALMMQSWRWTLDGFPDRPGEPLQIPLCPLISVDHVAYQVDGGGVGFWLEFEVDTDSEPGRLAPVFGQSWPRGRRTPIKAVQIDFTAGYATAGDAPESIRQALLQIVAVWYDNRGATSFDLPGCASEITAPLRVWSFA